MTRQEAFRNARKDWETEEKTFNETGAYKFDTETCKWLATLAEARTLAFNLNRELKDVKNWIDGDNKRLEHYARKDDWSCNRFGMRTIDPANASRLVRILSTALKELKAFEEDALKDY